jgi:hypothetical protein
MANYGIQNSTSIGAAQVACTTTYITLASVSASSVTPSPAIQLRRGKVYDILIGTNGTPADNYMEWQVARLTAFSTTNAYAGVCSSLSNQLDPADATMAAYAVVNSSIETDRTYTATNAPWYVGVNQRASYRWVAAPGSEIVWPATSSAGLGLRVKSGGYTGTATANILFSE